MPIRELVKRLTDQHMSMATAESCTGGLLAASVTSVPGSSACFSYGLVTYSNEAKHKLLHVPENLLATYGAVSSETAIAMAEGLLDLSLADLAVSITGIAGPDGGSEEKPVGLVYIGLAVKNGPVTFEECRFSGTRNEIRTRTVDTAIAMLKKYLEGANNV